MGDTRKSQDSLVNFLPDSFNHIRTSSKYSGASHMNEENNTKVEPIAAQKSGLSESDERTVQLEDIYSSSKTTSNLHNLSRGHTKVDLFHGERRADAPAVQHAIEEGGNPVYVGVDWSNIKSVYDHDSKVPEPQQKAITKSSIESKQSATWDKVKNRCEHVYNTSTSLLREILQSSDVVVKEKRRPQISEAGTQLTEHYKALKENIDKIVSILERHPNPTRAEYIALMTEFKGGLMMDIEKSYKQVREQVAKVWYLTNCEPTVKQEVVSDTKAVYPVLNVPIRKKQFKFGQAVCSRIPILGGCTTYYCCPTKPMMRTRGVHVNLTTPGVLEFYEGPLLDIAYQLDEAEQEQLRGMYNKIEEIST